MTKIISYLKNNYIYSCRCYKDELPIIQHNNLPHGLVDEEDVYN